MNTWIKLVRAAIHLPVGAVTALMSPVAAVLLFCGFIIYELNEDYHLKDGAYQDIAGYLVGLAVMDIIRGLFL